LLTEVINMARLTPKSANPTRARRPQPKRAPLTTHQRLSRKNARAQKQAAIDASVAEWFSATLAKAEELAERHGKKPRYFLDHFFHGGARMVVKRFKANAWNAWSSKVARDENSGQLITDYRFTVQATDQISRTSLG
jgi:hypothetical protein